VTAWLPSGLWGPDIMKKISETSLRDRPGSRAGRHPRSPPSRSVLADHSHREDVGLPHRTGRKDDQVHLVQAPVAGHEAFRLDALDLSR